METTDGRAALVRQNLPTTMRAAVCTSYGPPEVIRIVDVPMPRMGDHDVLVQIAAATVSTADWRIRAFAMPVGFGVISRLAFGIRKPRRPILGTEFSGTIVDVGKAVTRFRTGDAVIGYPGAGLVCHAEFRAMPEDGAMILKPAALSHVDAAALSFGGTTALHFLRDKGVFRKGQHVLVIGASGSVGTAAVQIARHLGAEITGVCSAANRDLVSSLGANNVIDYTTDDYRQHGRHYDLILDAIGVETFSRARRALALDGRFLMVAVDLPQMLRALTTAPSRQKAISSFAPERAEDMQYLADLADMGAFRPVIDQVYAFDRIVEAHRRVESRRKRGNVVVTLEPPPGSDEC